MHFTASSQRPPKWGARSGINFQRICLEQNSEMRFQITKKLLEFMSRVNKVHDTDAPKGGGLTTMCNEALEGCLRS